MEKNDGEKMWNTMMYEIPIDVGIVIPLFNHWRYIPETLRSIIANKYSCDIVIVDDCSTDGSFKMTQKICAKLISEVSDKIRLTISIMKNDKNLGLAATRNVGINKLDNKFVLCLDADDKISPNYLNDSVKNLILSKADINFPSIQFFGKSNHFIEAHQFSKREFYAGHNFVSCASMFRREVWETAKYDEVAPGFEDYSFWLQAHKNGYIFVNNPKTIHYYRKDEKSLSDIYEKRMDSIKKYMMKKHKGLILQ